MNLSSSRPTKILFLISRDYGEMFNAVYFSAGWQCAPIFLLPPSLYSANRLVFPNQVYEYRNASMVREIISREAPDVVLLFSGYLYVVNKVLETELGLINIIKLIDELNIPIATSDPSLGLLSDLTSDLFNERHPRIQWLRSHFSRMADILSERRHLYLAPNNHVSKASNTAYFNPNWAQIYGDCVVARDRLLAKPNFAKKKARWLFILSPEDINTQNYLVGAEAFIKIVSSQLLNASRQGHQAILIAPQSWMGTLVSAELGDTDTVLLPPTDFPTFIDWLIEAEYVFYWNQFSASIVGRMLAGRPFFVFDKGHLAYAMKPLYPIAKEHFYQGCHVQRLDADQPMSSNEIATLASTQAETLLEPMRLHFEQGISPELLISEIQQQNG